MVFVTGDCHGEFYRLSTKNFPIQREMTKADIVIVCGDFGTCWCWPMSAQEMFWLKWLDEKPFTTVFADGNHENFDILNNDYEVVDYHGGKAHKINNSVYHLMRGYVFNFEELYFFVMGGAASHDIEDGILYKENFTSEKSFRQTIKLWNKRKRQFRINRINWWEEELPNDEEYKNAEENLAKADYKVDYVISHCAPQHIIDMIETEHTEIPNRLTLFFDEVSEKLKFKKWFFAHYHNDIDVDEKYSLLYNRVIQVK